jgi:hypothetical protein
MGGPAKAPPRSASGSDSGDKVKIAYIGAIGVIVAALISGLFLYFSQGDSKDKQPSATSSSKVTVNVSPAVTPPAAPALKEFSASVFRLPAGQCAYVFSQPQVLQDDKLGCVSAATLVEIYCTVESQQVGDSTVWDEIYYRTSWGTTGFIPDYYVYTGTNNAVMPSCVT